MAARAPPGPGPGAPRPRPEPPPPQSVRPRRARPPPPTPSAPPVPTKCHYVQLDPASVPGPSGIKQCFRITKSLRCVPLLTSPSIAASHAVGPSAAPASASASAPAPVAFDQPSTSASAPAEGASRSRAPKRHDCRYCHKKFGSPGKLSQHVLSHTGELPFSCSQCDKRFNSKFKLVRHVLIHNETRPHACLHCSRTFHRKDHLANHARVHNPEKRVYACEKHPCKKQYTSPLNYKKHMALHSAEEGNLECKICSQTFETKEAIVYHLKVHAGSRTIKNEGDKKFNCSECDRKFFTAKDVRRHFVVHTRQRDFICTHCSHKFGRKDHLVRHVKKAHSEAAAQSPSTSAASAVKRPETERKKGKGETKRSKPETRLTKKQTETYLSLVKDEGPPPPRLELLTESGELFDFETSSETSIALMEDPVAASRDQMFIVCQPIEVKDEPVADAKLPTVPSMITLTSVEQTPSTSGLGKYAEEEFSDLMYEYPSMELETIDYAPRASISGIGSSELVPGLEASSILKPPVENILISDSAHGSQMTREELMMMTQRGQALPTFDKVFSTTAPSPKPQHPPK